MGYEQTMAKLQRKTIAVYNVELVWKCQIDKDAQTRHRELKQHLIVQHAPLNTRDVLYRGRNGAIDLHYAIGEGETIQSGDIQATI